MENKLNLKLTRNEAQILANCVTFQLNSNYGDCSFADKLNLLGKVNEVLDEFTMMEGE